MLQFRIFAYADAHRYRLGVNYENLSVNRPRVDVNNYHRDGAMRFDENGGGSVNYEPNSFDGPAENHRYKEPPLHVSGDVDRYNHREGNDDYGQPGNLYRLMTKPEQKRLHQAMAGAMNGVPREIVERQLGHLAKADPGYAEGVKKALGWK
jgi:catalase